jgi:hypothetical protein
MGIKAGTPVVGQSVTDRESESAVCRQPHLSNRTGGSGSDVLPPMRGLDSIETRPGTIGARAGLLGSMMEEKRCRTSDHCETVCC